jgi:hypothetical protein
MRHTLLLWSAAIMSLAPAACKGGAARSPSVNDARTHTISALSRGFEGEITLHTVRVGSPPQDVVVKAKNNKLRFDTTTNGMASSAIFDPTQNKVVLILDEQRVYLDMDFASSVSQPNADPKINLRDKLGTKDTVAGVECENWVVKDGSGRRSKACLAEGLTFFDMDGLKSGQISLWSEQMREKRLFPLRSVDFDATGKETSRTEAIKIERKSLDDSTFEVPKGYRKITLPLGGK